MAEEMTIGRLARATGIPESTIRFYERQGLLRPGSRSSGNYRLYGRPAAERLTFIGAAQAAGFELPEIKAILSLETGRVACGRASELVTLRLGSLRDQMLKLRQLERVLQKVQRACAGRPADAPCVVADPFVLRRWLRR
jgi:MerR family Zn(II)-responsive transcriptional regulator of zntA